MHAGAASGAFIAPSSAPAGESGSIMEVWQRATRSSRQSLPRRLGGSAERSAQTRDPLLHEGSGETHPVWGRRGAAPAHNPAISHGSHAGVSATHGGTGAPAMGTPSGEAHQGSGGYADDWRNARLRPAGGPGGRAPAEAWPPVVATVDDAEEEETYLQRLVELQQVLGSGDGCQGPLCHGGSTAAESSLPSAPRSASRSLLRVFVAVGARDQVLPGVDIHIHRGRFFGFKAHHGFRWINLLLMPPLFLTERPAQARATSCHCTQRVGHCNA